MFKKNKNNLIYNSIFFILILIFIFILINKQNGGNNNLLEDNEFIVNKIFYSIKKDDVITFKELLNKYPTEIYKIKNKNNQNIIHLICLHNSINILREIIDKIDKKYLIEYDSFGNYPLKYAIIKNNIEIVNLLISKVDREQRDKFLGFTPFLVAAFSNKLEILKILYKNGCDINSKDLRFNNNALFWAVRKYNLDIIKYLIDDLKMDYKQRDNEGNTIFYEACSSFINDQLKCNSTLEYLYSLDNNFINIPNNDGVYPILIATFNYNIFPLIFIINKSKETVFIKDNQEYNIIDYLMLTENPENIKIIIKILKEYYSKNELKELLTSSFFYNLNKNINYQKQKLNNDINYKKYINLINEEIYN
ncbi:MAG: ankyrin repeat domain-containing protein [bacterium]|nr:ankyrin repeat domain-containing protein [bacterium]